ncbi:MAG: hypothetical protein HY717_24445 [Planctomycetes bacterium]|nr:hypothetical protein [Planctomycetota bacterium]
MLRGICIGLLALAWTRMEAWAQSEEAALTAWKADIKKKEQAIGKRFVETPKGKSYEAAVPDTLDLADRARLGINCLTGALDPDYGYELYFIVQFKANPPFMVHEASGLPTNNPKFAESMPMMRLMSGSDQNLDIERGMLERTLALVHTDGLYYAPIIGRPWHQTWHKADEDFANVYGNARQLLAFLAWYQYDGNPMWLEYAKGIVSGLKRIARIEGDKAYFPDPRIGESFSYPKSGYPANLPEPTDIGFSIHMYFSGVMRGFAKYAAMTGDQDTLEFTRKLVNFVHQPKMWGAAVQPAGVTSAERGHLSGHFHAHVASLRGLLEYAIVASDAGLKEFARNGYEFARNFGISDIGWFPEGAATGQHCEACCIADMVGLAVKLCDAGVGDYWEDVDRYTRNQLVEQQFVSAELLRKAAESSALRKASPPRETDDRVIERNIGGFAGHGDIAVLPNSWIMHCCTGNATQALYYAWEGIVRKSGQDSVQINLLLNRASPWVDIDSYLPYEGRVVITNKTARRAAVRIPNWASRSAVRVAVGSQQVEPLWVGNYMVLEKLLPEQKIEIAFPVVERSVAATLEGVTYKLNFRGNTLIDYSIIGTAANSGIRGGKLALDGSRLAVVEGVKAKEAKVTVDARSNAEAGIVLRYKDPGNFLLAHYNGQSIYFHEVAGGGFGGALNSVPVSGLGENIKLSAEVAGPEVSMALTDGNKTFTTKHTIANLTDAPVIGLFHNNAPAQLFDSFRAADLQGNALFEDAFAGPDGTPKGWKVVNWSAPSSVSGNDYPIYQRAAMRSSKAPMVTKTRYVLDKHIEQ